MESQSETTQTMSALKLPILKTGDYDLWSMRMEQYLTHTDYALWEVIMNGDAPAIASASTEGPERARVFTDLTAEEKERYKADIRATNILLQVSNASNQKYPTQSSESPQSSNQPSIVDNCQMDTGSTSTDNLIESLTNTLSLLNQSFKTHLPQTNNQLRTSSNARNNATVQDVVVQDVRGRYNANNQGSISKEQMQEGNVVSWECWKVTNFDDDVFEADQCDAFDSDVDEAPTTQTMFMGVQSRSTNKQVKVVNDTLTSELARYKELVGVYEQRAKFELTDRERKIDEQMRIIISDRNRKETSLKSELHSAQCNFRSTLTIIRKRHSDMAEITWKRMMEENAKPSMCGKKKHFVGVQTALFKEVKVMEEIFDQMSNEVDQNVMDKQCAKIVKKNLLIENENLICRTGHPLVSGLRLFKTYDRDRSKLKNIVEKFIGHQNRNESLELS
ncbi:hypothetical protein Tco_0443400 [Tanacetum coccineum]